MAVIGFSIQMPAELTRMSRRPAGERLGKQALAVGRTTATVAEHGRKGRCARPARAATAIPAASTATASARSWSRPATTTEAPSAASRWTIARPRPDEPPVTSATCLTGLEHGLPLRKTRCRCRAAYTGPPQRPGRNRPGRYDAALTPHQRMAATATMAAVSTSSSIETHSFTAWAVFMPRGP